MGIIRKLTAITALLLLSMPATFAQDFGGAMSNLGNAASSAMNNAGNAVNQSNAPSTSTTSYSSRSYSHSHSHRHSRVHHARRHKRH